MTPESSTGVSALRVRGLEIGLRSGRHEAILVADLNLDLYRGETLALVGESGCGKSLTALALSGLLEAPLFMTTQSVSWHGNALERGLAIELARLRGRKLAIIFQDPANALNPVMRVGEQIAEVLRIHLGASTSQAWLRAVELLTDVGIDAAEDRVRAYPHELSGGMRQRVLIAMALACDPDVLIADEPTTALDVTTQAQILALLRQTQRARNMAMLFITHDLALLPWVADQVAVMYAGRIVERRPVGEFINHPRHPYARALLNAAPVRGKPLRGIEGEVPEMSSRPSGCAFHPRCSRVTTACRDEQPPMTRGVACFDPHPEQFHGSS